MIIKAAPHNNGGNLARYLLTEKAHERVFVLDLRDSASDDLSKSLSDWEAIARSKTKGERVLYHSHIRLRDGESLNEAQWFKVIQDLEESLGFTNCPRAIVGHNSSANGLHVHVVWSRLDPVTNKLVSLSNDRREHHAVARSAEREFGLEPVQSREERRARKRRLSDREVRALKDRGINQERLVKMVRAAWNATESGEEMRAMLNALGVSIERGDRRDYVVEFKGLKMNPVRLIETVSTAEFRERMSDAHFERPREKSPVDAAFGRKARNLAQEQVDRQIANDQERPPAKSGFRTKRHQGSQPRLRPRLYYRDPGI